MSGPAFTVQGWCPGALRPMMSGDGLVVRLRPPGGRLTPTQVDGIAAAARAFGNGMIELSARANVQLRGISEANHPALIDALRDLGLTDPDPATEARRNMTVTPFADAVTDRLAAELALALAHAPDLPGKFGFAVDTGPAPVLRGASADIRLERAADGGLLLRCDGAPFGARVIEPEAAQAVLALAQWFVAAGGVQDARGRMAALIATGAGPTGALAPMVAPALAVQAPDPGLCPQGALLGFAFGQIGAETFAKMALLGALRVTPWRMVLVEGLDSLPDLPGVLTRPDAPLRRVMACTGAPGCGQAFAPVRDLARRLAPQVPPGRVLHVSGCAKGCAHPAAADVTLVATARGFDLIRDGAAQARPDVFDLAAAQIDLKGLF
ncbi:MAG: precorrin-3B synthase [Rhodobacteraceae bacterium]|nr:precorrin-3B synthase [Paracoccaceae bacterium]